MIREFQGIRGILAWWVVVGHIIGFSGNIGKSTLLGSIIGNGYIPVDVFIIMSGFVIMLLLDKKKEPYSKFIIRRFFRLAPVLIICFFITFLIVDFWNYNLHNVGWMSSPGWESRILRLNTVLNHKLEHVLLHLSMLHGVVPKEILPSSADAFLVPAWSISLEWQFYLIAPVIYFLATRKQFKFILIPFVIILFLFLVPELGGFYNGNKGFILLNIPLFSIGIISYFFYKNQKIKLSINTTTYISILFIISLFLKLAIVIWVASFLLIFIKENKIIDKIKLILKSPLLFTIGDISYSTYLVHWPVIIFIQFIILKTYPEVSRIEMFILLFATVLPIVFLLSYILNKFIEKPFINLAKKIND